MRLSLDVRDAFTTHIRLERDFGVYPSTRGYTYQQLVGGRQAHAAQQWMHSDRVYQEREDAKKIKHHWYERKIIRAFGSNEKNGGIQPTLYTPIDIMAEHVYAPRATPAPQPNKHLMVRDDYPEVLRAESSALPGKKHNIPRTGPEAVASWSTRISREIPSETYQMDPLSSPSDLSPLHVEETPLM